jgi:hypothetical protein
LELTDLENKVTWCIVENGVELGIIYTSEVANQVIAALRNNKAVNNYEPMKEKVKTLSEMLQIIINQSWGVHVFNFTAEEQGKLMSAQDEIDEAKQLLSTLEG